MLRCQQVVRTHIRRAVVSSALAGTVLCGSVFSQPGSSKAARVSALLAYPVFFHGQRVTLRGELTTTESESTLAVGEQSVRLLGVDGAGAGLASGEAVELRGTFWDVGRLDPGDPRLTEYDVPALSRRWFGTDWPRSGDLLAVAADAVEPATRPMAPSVRAVALEPGRYAGQSVTIAGRFRGRNLFADLPQGPNVSRFDFVVQSADGAVWITGKEPRGDGFNLDGTARVDTGKWLEVAGVVRHARGLVWLEAQRIALATPPSTPTAAAPPPTPSIQEPPPEVIFSAPLPDDTDVSRDTTVRLQFSRDMDSDSFDGHVRVSYLGEESFERGEPDPPALGIAIEYLRGRRVLQIGFTTELDRFRTVRVELLEGVQATDGTPLPPWTLSFSLGGT